MVSSLTFSLCLIYSRLGAKEEGNMEMPISTDIKKKKIQQKLALSKDQENKELLDNVALL